MNDFLDRIFLNNALRDYAWVIGFILFALLLNRLMSRYIARLLARLLRRVWPSFDRQKFTDLIVQPLGTFLAVTVTIIALYRLQYPELFKFTIYKYPLQRVFLSLGIMVQLISLTWLLLRIIDFIATVLEAHASKTLDQSDNQLIVFFRDFLKVIIGIIGGLLVLKFAFGYDVSSLLTGLSIVGAAIALALRESLENLIASFVIFFDKPFTTGDTVRVQNVTGTVEKIGLRSTRIRSDQKTWVTVPNKQMVDTILDNQSLRNFQRNELLLQISAKTSSARIEELMVAVRNYLKGIPDIDSTNVWFLDINVQAYVVQVEFFLPKAHLARFNQYKQELNLFVLRKMEELGIEVAGAREVGRSL